MPAVRLERRANTRDPRTLRRVPDGEAESQDIHCLNWAQMSRNPRTVVEVGIAISHMMTGMGCYELRYVSSEKMQGPSAISLYVYNYLEFS